MYFKCKEVILSKKRHSWLPSSRPYEHDGIASRKELRMGVDIKQIGIFGLSFSRGFDQTWLNLFPNPSNKICVLGMMRHAL